MFFFRLHFLTVRSVVYFSMISLGVHVNLSFSNLSIGCSGSSQNSHNFAKLLINVSTVFTRVSVRSAHLILGSQRGALTKGGRSLNI